MSNNGKDILYGHIGPRNNKNIEDREFITRITEVFNQSLEDESSVSILPDYYNYDGFLVETNKQKIYLVIENTQACCENWGYLISEDDTSKFIGAELYDIRLTDTNLSTYEVRDLDEGDVMFIDLLTSNGTLQFVAYNEHNGYYGHEAKVVSKSLNHHETL